MHQRIALYKSYFFLIFLNVSCGCQLKLIVRLTLVSNRPIWTATVSFVTKSFIQPVCVMGSVSPFTELHDSICNRLFQLGAKHRSLLEV